MPGYEYNSTSKHPCYWLKYPLALSAPHLPSLSPTAQRRLVRSRYPSGHLRPERATTPAPILSGRHLESGANLHAGGGGGTLRGGGHSPTSRSRACRPRPAAWRQAQRPSPRQRGPAYSEAGALPLGGRFWAVLRQREVEHSPAAAAAWTAATATAASSRPSPGAHATPFSGPATVDRPEATAPQVSAAAHCVPPSAALARLDVTVHTSLLTRTAAATSALGSRAIPTRYCSCAAEAAGVPRSVLPTCPSGQAVLRAGARESRAGAERILVRLFL